MSLKGRLLSFSSNLKLNAKGYAKRTIAKLGRNERNVDVALRSVLADDKVLCGKNDLASYVGLLRACIEPTALRAVTVKSGDHLDSVHANRFRTLIDTIRNNLLPIPIAMALQLAEEADRLRGMTAPIDIGTWAADLGLHFALSSSLGHKGRLLANAIRLCRSERCLELGTAYGMSAMFMLEMQPYLDWTIHLTTVEGYESLFKITSQRLKDRYRDSINCHYGWTQDVLPELVSKLGPIDFMFHDAGHSREDYVRDFGAVVDTLAPGSVIIIDDIRYSDARFGGVEAYRGWRDIVAHARIRHAVEVAGGIGLALLS
jgi:predicted O-methyltransferase YrrM